MQELHVAEAKLRENIQNASYSWLMSHCAEAQPGELIARMLASLQAGIGDMPRYLGLSRVEFRSMLSRYFPGMDAEHFVQYGSVLDPERSDEHAELRTLMLEHAQIPGREAAWAADILIAGCMGGDHLWQDLGFWSRADLTAFIRSAFAPLADKNVFDMKWKKFFYKQLCIQEGVYTCRAPSCQVCADYAACFGPE
jgi:nitrogen fixation protein NifQ